jgi:hypothetical protein
LPEEAGFASHQIGSVAYAIDGVTFLHLCLAVLSYFDHDPREIATQTTTYTTYTRGVIMVGGVNCYCYSFDFDAVWWKYLLVDISQGGDSKFLNDDSFHGVVEG